MLLQMLLERSNVLLGWSPILYNSEEWRQFLPRSCQFGIDHSKRPLVAPGGWLMGMQVRPHGRSSLLCRTRTSSKERC